MINTIIEKDKPIDKTLNNPIILNIENEVEKATTDLNSKNKTTLGKVNSDVANKIHQLLGINVLNRNHVINDNDIRHILKKHGNPKIEGEKGQLPINKNDILNIPSIINNPDSIVRGTDNNNTKAVRYIKKYDDNISYVIEVIPENNNNLIIKTMWKKPSTLANDKSLASTS